MIIQIQDAEPGMTLAQDVILPDGSGVIKKSVCLTSDTIIQITLAGVTRLSIADPGTETGGPGSPPKPLPETVRSPMPSPVPSPSGAIPPRIQILIAENALSAKLVVEPAGAVSGELTEEAIREALEANGVTHGINESGLPDIVRRWNSSKKKGEFDAIAEGTPAKPGKEAPCNFKVPHLIMPRDLDVVRKARRYADAAKHVGNLHRVAKSTVVAEKRFEIPPQPARNVKGEPVPGEETSEEIVSLESGVGLSDDGRQIVAETDGILYAVNNAIGIVPLDFNGSFELSTDKMSARLHLCPPGEGGAMPPEIELRHLLESNLIVFGVKDTVITELMAKLAKGEMPADMVIVAEGVPPEHGQNGKVEFLFNTKTSLAPKVNPDGSVDYKNVDIIIAVPKGKELVRLEPPKPGKPGKSIFGDPIPCREGSPSALPVGPNTEAGSDGGTLVASIDGIVRYTGAYVEVCEGYVIKGDVDFSTGNIKYDKSVIIKGDVKAGFSVDCGGDLQVSGLIEDCIINVGGNVLCKHGFIGQGKGVIEAKGDVNIGFILNQTIKSRKNVNVAKEAINCTIYARQAITIHGNPLSIAGGSLVARDSITVHTVGNHSGVRTTLEVGLDFALLEDLRKNEELLEDINQKHRKLSDSIQKYQHKINLGKKLPPNEDMLYNKLRIAIIKIEEQKGLLEKRKGIIELKMHELEKAHIKIGHSGMPGTCFKIGELRHFCKDELIGPKTVRLIKGELTIA